MSQLGFDGCEEVGGIHRVVAQELEYIAVEAVRARLGDGVHHRAAELSVFGIEAVGDKAKLLDRIKIWNQPRAQVAALADIAPVHQKRVRSLALTVH